MIPAWHMLAQEREPTGHLIYLVALIVVAIIFAVVRGLKKRLDASQQARQSQEPQQPERRYGPIPPQQPPTPQPPPLPPQPNSIEQFAQAVRRSMGLDQQPAAPPRRRPPPVVLQPAEADLARVDDEVRQQQLRLQREEEERQRRLTTPRSSLEQRRLAPGAGSLSFAGPGAYGVTEVERPIGIGRLDRGQARMAIVYLEILSPPKALRRGPESWDV